MDANKHGIEAGPVLNENEPQINADERRLNESVSIEKDCLGMSTYREAIRVVWESRTVRFRHDERRFNESVSIEKGCMGLRF